MPYTQHNHAFPMAKTKGHQWIKGWEWPAGLSCYILYPFTQHTHTIKGKWGGEVFKQYFIATTNDIETEFPEHLGSLTASFTVSVSVSVAVSVSLSPCPSESLSDSLKGDLISFPFDFQILSCAQSRLLSLGRRPAWGICPVLHLINHTRLTFP